MCIDVNLLFTTILFFFRQQILTPAFHFKILEDFIDVFQEQSAIMVDKLKVESEKNSFNIFPYVTLCTLDIICGKYFYVSIFG